MAKPVIWTLRAQEDRKTILAYWRKRNKSNAYSKKLNLLFKNAIITIKEFPEIGKQTDDKRARIKVVRDYLLIYEESDTSIYILTIWDTRQDPDKLEKIIR
ncbi:MAG: type II toxin-antitoxin system RelE/ParE family toxin [Cyclobacteriaceae bacterium]|jgi:addiction module RelE/StbE family toxin